jgi:chorismate dehydratase
LLREYWKKEVQFIDASGDDFRDKIMGTTAGVVIGDRALEQRNISTYIYDLGEAWKEHTGLPFVFAAWISNKKLPEEFMKAFDEANAMGLNKIDEVIKENYFIHYDLKKYYTKYINYQLDDEKRKGLALFLKKLRDLNKV